MNYFSIIIPVFNNTNEEIDRCLQSILNQTYNKYEIIIIDDGSKKECATYLDNYRRNNISIYHKSNEGVSIARNYGLKYSHGNYITFVDADDIISKTMLEEANIILSKNDIDILYGLVKYVHDISFVELNRNSFSNFKILSLEDKEMLHTHMYHLGKKEFWRKNSYVSRGPVAKILKKSVMDNNLFNSHLIFGEDEEWNFRLLESQDYNIAVAYNIWYYYIFARDSTLHKFRLNFIELSEQRLEIMQSFIWNTNDQVELMKEGFSVVKEIFYRYYFSKENMQSFFSITKDFNQLLYRKIWKSIFRFDLSYKSDISLLIKYILLYIRILPLILYLNNIMDKKKV
jgi:hypothetical protein